MQSVKSQSVAVIGAGMAGASCARALMQAGHAVHVFDKAREPGGRLATRRVEWVGRQGQTCTTRLDHGAVGITARTASFQTFIDEALRAGWVAAWAPTLAVDSLPSEDGDRFYLPVPTLPALCQRLLEGASASWSSAVDRLQKGPLGWQVLVGGERHPAHFDAVVLALPPAQAAPLLSPHRSDWARHASVVTMQPCWTLMGMAQAPEPALGWDLARPPTGPLGWVLRNDSRPGRQRVPGQAHWVVHARAGWSRQHLEQPAAWVQQHLQAALADCLGQPLDWQHCIVHRWRYARPQAQRPALAPTCWWDATQRLGVCADFLGGTGVEGAWLSGQSLSAALRQGGADGAEAAEAAGACGARGSVHEAAHEPSQEPDRGPAHAAASEPAHPAHDAACHAPPRLAA